MIGLHWKPRVGPKSRHFNGELTAKQSINFIRAPPCHLRKRRIIHIWKARDSQKVLPVDVYFLKIKLLIKRSVDTMTLHALNLGKKSCIHSHQ